MKLKNNLAELLAIIVFQTFFNQTVGENPFFSMTGRVNKSNPAVEFATNTLSDIKKSFTDAFSQISNIGSTVSGLHRNLDDNYANQIASKETDLQKVTSSALQGLTDPGGLVQRLFDAQRKYFDIVKNAVAKLLEVIKNLLEQVVGVIQGRIEHHKGITGLAESANSLLTSSIPIPHIAQCAGIFLQHLSKTVDTLNSELVACVTSLTEGVQGHLDVAQGIVGLLLGSNNKKLSEQLNNCQKNEIALGLIGQKNISNHIPTVNEETGELPVAGENKTDREQIDKVEPEKNDSPGLFEAVKNDEKSEPEVNLDLGIEASKVNEEEQSNPRVKRNLDKNEIKEDCISAAVSTLSVEGLEFENKIEHLKLDIPKAIYDLIEKNKNCFKSAATDIEYFRKDLKNCLPEQFQWIPI